MNRYIDADKFAKQAYEIAYPIIHDTNSHERGLTLIGISQLLDEQPTADVRENVRAVWIEQELQSLLGRTHTETRCGNCGFEVYRKTPFCPNCGADMRGGA